MSGVYDKIMMSMPQPVTKKRAGSVRKVGVYNGAISKKIGMYNQSARKKLGMYN